MNQRNPDEEGDSKEAKFKKEMQRLILNDQTLTSLDLSYNQIGAEGMQSLSECLKVNQTLTNLNLSENLIGAKGMETLSEALKVNQTLTNLVLFFNQIRDEGMQPLCESLKFNQTLTVLSLSMNKIRAKGMKPLFESLKVNQTLTNLDLSCNQIVGEGIQALCEALKVNHHLTQLNLSDNRIGSKGLKYLSEALKINQTLIHLNLSQNKIRYYNDNREDQYCEKNLQEFIQSLKINKSITKLYIERNNIIEKNIYKIYYFIERNFIFQKKLTKSVKVGNLQCFQQLIQIEKIPLIYKPYSYQPFGDYEETNNPNNQEENTIFHTAIFHNQTEILFYLLFANNEKTDQQIISKRNFLLNFKNAKTKKSAIDLLNPNEILIQDFKNCYNQFISSYSFSSSSFSSTSSSFSTSYFNNNEQNNNFPNKLIAEKEIILMRIGKEWKTIKNEFQNELTEKQKQLFLKWLYCPVSLKFQEKQIILEVFKLLNINQFEKQTLFSNEKLLNDFQNYIKKYTNSEKKIFQINLKKKKKKKKTKKNKKKNEKKKKKKKEE
ncbi:leucine rich repeat family protein [Anaeramoeba flamelloides]|uniref:Leucine rich repeat family protein n=1 Tax=Anaeramoeba flamelloides TaxID=1746091 RepID=A0AAV7YZM7_9EUKA|nr:leucine rich repeat family protein [Anaeramoeba flamelloides]